MSQQFTVDLDDQLAEALKQWMVANNVTDSSQVFAQALQSYLSSNLASGQNTVENATMAELEEHLPDLMKEHKEAMDLLK